MTLFHKKSTKELVQGGVGSAPANAEPPAEEPEKEKRARAVRFPQNNRLALGVLCILAAAVIAFVLLPRLYSAKNELTTVVRLSQSVDAGAVITEEMLTESETSAYGLPQGFVRTKEEAVGKVAAQPLYSGEYLWSARLTDAGTYQKLLDEQARGLTEGCCLVTVELPGASSGVAGVLRAGDTVDVFEYHQTEETGAYTVALRLPELHVIDVLNSNLVSLSEPDELAEQGGDAAAVSGSDALPVYAVFRCSEDQARELIRLEKEQALHMVVK